MNSAALMDRKLRVSVYASADLRTDEVRYVGKANDPEQRYRAHIAFGVTPAAITQLVCGQTRIEVGGPTREPKQKTRLTGNEIDEIRRLAFEGVKQVDIACQFGVSQGHISNIVSQERQKRP